MSYIKKPMMIESTSFDIIDDIIKEEGRVYPSESELHRLIFRRVIHTSADFDYLDNLKIDPEFITVFESVINTPLTVYTDTQMALSGINKAAFGKLPWELKCLVGDENVRALAKEEGITRSMAAISVALQTEGKKLFVIGNAPTAIFKLLEADEKTLSDVVGVIGVPVGFVGAAESKEMLYEHAIPSIAALGRKGGSNVAAAIVNALMYYFIGRNE